MGAHCRSWTVSSLVRWGALVGGQDRWGMAIYARSREQWISHIFSPNAWTPQQLVQCAWIRHDHGIVHWDTRRGPPRGDCLQLGVPERAGGGLPRIEHRRDGGPLQILGGLLQHGPTTSVRGSLGCPRWWAGPLGYGHICKVQKTLDLTYFQSECMDDTSAGPKCMDQA